MAKTELNFEHLDWLGESRPANLKTGLKLLKILRKHPDSLPGMQVNAQRLVGVAFSLWRAAFLADGEVADKPGTVAVAHAASFLERLIQNNAINYAEDRSARNWTFGYYMNAAGYTLTRLGGTWPAVIPKSMAGKKRSERWNYLHQLFDTAVDLFEIDVTKVVVANLKAEIASAKRKAAKPRVPRGKVNSNRRRGRKSQG